MRRTAKERIVPIVGSDAIADALSVNELWIHHIFPAMEPIARIVGTRVSRRWHSELSNYFFLGSYENGSLSRKQFEAHSHRARYGIIKINKATTYPNVNVPFDTTWLSVSMCYLIKLDLDRVRHSNLNEILPHMTQLRDLRLSRSEPDNSASGRLEVSPNLTNLTIGRNMLLPARRARILTNLRSLELWCNGRTPSRTIGLLTSLVSLETHASRVYGTHLVKLTNLDTLSLSYTGRVHDEVTDTDVAKLTSLVTLSLDMAPNVSGSCLSALTNLIYLSLGSCISSNHGRFFDMHTFQYAAMRNLLRLNTLQLYNHFSANSHDLVDVVSTLTTLRIITTHDNTFGDSATYKIRHPTAIISYY